MVYLKTTIKSEKRVELDTHWLPTSNVAMHYPLFDSQFVNSMSPHPSHLARLTADFDGDTMSGNIVYTEEAIAEVKKAMASRKYYVGPNGKMYYSADTDIISYVLKSITS